MLLQVPGLLGPPAAAIQAATSTAQLTALPAGVLSWRCRGPWMQGCRAALLVFARTHTVRWSGITRLQR